MGEVETAAAAIASEDGEGVDRLRRLLAAIHLMNARRYTGDEKLHRIAGGAHDSAASRVVNRLANIAGRMTADKQPDSGSRRYCKPNMGAKRVLMSAGKLSAGFDASLGDLRIRQDQVERDEGIERHIDLQGCEEWRGGKPHLHGLIEG
jgi:hypothetical protein